MNLSDNVNTKFVCQYCHSNIKGKDEMLSCPKCSAVYHIECWYENEGCGVYGCTYKVSSPKIKSDEISIQELLVNAEYLINVRHFVEALNECSRILSVDKTNTEAKKIYNKTVTLINTKTRLIENGDIAFQSNDLKTAEIYYKEAFKYTDESETDLINAKLQIIKEKYPRILRKKRINNFITALLSLLIIASTAFLIYYYVYQREQREFSAIEKGDNVNEIPGLEMQVVKYEKFVQQFKDAELLASAKEKINILALRLISMIYKEDWRSSYRYLQKIDTAVYLKTYKDYKSKIFKSAKEEFNRLFSDAKNLDKEKKYPDSKNVLEKAYAIIDIFPDTELRNDKSRISAGITLMNKKQSAAQKINDIEREISEKEKSYEQLKKYSGAKSTELTLVIKDVKSSSLAIARMHGGSKLVAVRTGSEQYYEGETISLECIRDGSITYDSRGEEVTLPLYVPVFSGSYNDNTYSKFEFESVVQRLRYLKEQREKLNNMLETVF